MDNEFAVSMEILHTVNSKASFTLTFMGAILGQRLDQLGSGVALEPFNVHRTTQQQFQQFLDQGPILRGDSVGQPHVHQGPPAGRHKLAQQFRFSAFQNLYVNTLGYEFFGELRHQAVDETKQRDICKDLCDHTRVKNTHLARRLTSLALRIPPFGAKSTLRHTKSFKGSIRGC